MSGTHGATGRPPFGPGTHADFWARIGGALGGALPEWSTREPTDLAIALLDAWAVAADVLAAYQGWYFREAYLGTATERRSLAELARLVGYKPRPALAAACDLTFSLEAGHAVEIPAGSKVQSTPGPNQMAQVFETSAALDARAEWNEIRPRRFRPQHVPDGEVQNVTEFTFAGTGLNLKANDLLVFAYPGATASVRRVQEVTEDAARSVTRVRLQFDDLATARLVAPTREAEALSRAFLIPDTLVVPDSVKALTDREKEWRTTLGGRLVAPENLIALDDGLTGDSKALRSLVTESAALADTLDGQHAALKTAYTALRDAALVAGGDAALATAVAGIKKMAQTDPLLRGLEAKLSPDIDDGADLATINGRLSDLQTAKNGFVSHLIDSSGAALTDEPTELVDLAKRFANLPAAADAGNLAATRTELKSLRQKVAVEKWTAAAGDGLNIKEQTEKADPQLLDSTVGELDAWLLSTPNGEITPDGLKKRWWALWQRAVDVAGARAPIRELVQKFSTLDGAAGANLEAKFGEYRNAVRSENPNTEWKTVQHVRAAAGALAAAMPAPTADDFLARLKSVADALRRLSGGLNGFRASLEQALWATRNRVAVRLASVGTQYVALRDDDATRDLYGRLYPGAFGAWLDKVKLPDAPPTDFAVLEATRLRVLDDANTAARPDIQRFLATVGGEIRPAATRFLSLVESVFRQMQNKAPSAVPTGPTGLDGPDGVFALASQLRREGATATGLAGPFPGLLSDNTNDQPTDAQFRLLRELNPEVGDDLFTAWRGLRIRLANPLAVFALRQKTQLFGYNAPPQVTSFDTVKQIHVTAEPVLSDDEQPERLCLSEPIDGIVPGGYVVVERTEPPDTPLAAFQVGRATVRPLTRYGISGRTTEVVLADAAAWYTKPAGPVDKEFRLLIRTTGVHALSTPLELATVEIATPVGVPSGQAFIATPTERAFVVEADEIELDGLFPGLAAGRRVVVRGNRQDVSGVRATFAARVVGVRHVIRPDVHDDTPHTVIRIDPAPPAALTRDTVSVFANVVAATHGETRDEVLGSGDPRKPFQEFALKSGPLAFLTTPGGPEPAITVRVNGLEWTRVEDLADLEPGGHGYVVRAEAGAEPAVVFGDGERGERPPTGVANVVAQYRQGGGPAGNLLPGQLATPLSRPLGVSGVTNPRAATGGTAPDPADVIRENAPIPVRALGRPVSVHDYADFARAAAGVAKAAAVVLPGEDGPVVHVTVAAIDDAPLEAGGELVRNLRAAMHRFGSDTLPIVVTPRRRKLLVLEMRVRPSAGHSFTDVEQRVRARLTEEYGFGRRRLGQSVDSSGVLTVVQNLPGVEFVDLDVCTAIADPDPETTDPVALQKWFEDELAKLSPKNSGRRADLIPAAAAAYDPINRRYLSAELIVLSPNVHETLSIREVR